MVRQLVQRLPGGKKLAILAIAAALAVGGLSMTSIQAPSASAQCFYLNCYNGYTSAYGYYPYGNLFGYGNGYSNYYNNYYGYNNYSYGYNPYSYGYYNNYSYGYPYNNYSSYYPYNYGYSSYYPTTAYAYPTTGITYTTSSPTYTYATQPVVSTGYGATYSTSGSYCMVGSEQVWVPSGASPQSYGCS